MTAFVKMILPYIFCGMTAYLSGSVNFAWLIAKRKGFDIRTKGSGNAGTTNAGRTMGLAVGGAVFALDVIKAAAVVFMAGYFFSGSPAIQTVTAACCVLGHLYPFYLDFRGGKGVAVLLGSALALDWRVFLVMLVGIGLILLLTDYMFIATLTAAVGYWLWYYFSGKSIADLAVLLGIVALIFWKHRSNFTRFFAGKENRMGISIFRKRNRAAEDGKSQ